jgi:hypothetical protein
MEMHHGDIVILSGGGVPGERSLLVGVQAKDLLSPGQSQNHRSVHYYAGDNLFLEP